MNGQTLQLGIGVLLLFFGRKLFWFFVGVVGFLSGIQFAPQFLPTDSRITVMAIALALGLLGAILAIFVQHAVVVLAGFLAGGHLVMRVLTLLNWQNDQYMWLLALFGGILGGILALMLLDWGLIILSSLVGASLVSQALPFDQTATALCVIVLAASGIPIQSRLLQRPMAVV
jgi:Domain of unknown function (DUF4203)